MGWPSGANGFPSYTVYEHDPFLSPSAMRLGSGGSWKSSETSDAGTQRFTRSSPSRVAVIRVRLDYYTKPRRAVSCAFVTSCQTV